MHAYVKWVLMLNAVIALGPSSSNAFADEDVLTAIERRIVREPQYDGKPRYVLLALGKQADTLIWVVEDGRKLYIDQNANRDLTDDGPPLEPTKQRDWRRSVDSNAKSWDFEYELDEFTPPGSKLQKNFRLRRWNYGVSSDDSYGLSLTLDDKVPMYAGWVPFWASSPEKAAVIHFGGALTPKLLRYQEFTLRSHPQRLSVAFYNPGLGSGAKSLLSIDGPDANMVPILHIEWPTAAGEAPLQTAHNLYQRCCYWEFYTTEFEVPEQAVAGTAQVSIEVPPGSLLLPLTTTQIEVPVVPAKDSKADPK